MGLISRCHVRLGMRDIANKFTLSLVYRNYINTFILRFIQQVGNSFNPTQYDYRAFKPLSNPAISGSKKKLIIRRSPVFISDVTDIPG